MNKFQRSTFQTSSLILASHKNIVSSETTRPFELKFHMKTPYDRLAKIYTNCTGHTTKMATKSIYGKNSEYDQEIPQSQTADNPVAPQEKEPLNPLNILFSITRLTALGLGM